MRFHSYSNLILELCSDDAVLRQASNFGKKLKKIGFFAYVFPITLLIYKILKNQKIDFSRKVPT